MTLKIAITGKGGVGKTAVSTFIAKVLAEETNYKILLIDADPTHPHLSHMVNLVPENSLEKIRQNTISKALEKDHAAKSIAEYIDFEIYNAIKESKQFSVLYIGQPEEPGCFCPSNALLRKVIESLARDYDLILIDCEAGLEQINRMVLSSIDYLLIVVDMSRRSVDTAQSIRRSAKKFSHYSYLGLIMNKVRGNVQSLKKLIKELGFNIDAVIPYDESVLSLDLEGTPLIDIQKKSASIKSLEPVLKRIQKLKKPF